MSFFGGGSQSAPKQPPFTPIKLGGQGGIANQALQQDIQRYMSYTFPLYPGMTALRQNEINDAYKQLTSPLSPEFSNAFLRNASVGQQAVTGGGDPFSGMGLGTGSFGSGAMSSSFARQDLAKQDYDRARMESLQNQNPLPGLGLSQNDLLSLSVYNTGAQNTWAMSNYANQIAAANATYGANQANYAAIGNLIGGLGQTYANYNAYNQGNFSIPSNLFDSFGTAVPQEY